MPTFLDHASTTPVRGEVKEELLRALDVVGNPGSVHLAGQGARAELAQARERLARALGAHPSEVVFLSGGTEANNLGIKGLFEARRSDGRNLIIVPSTEHHAVLEPINHLADHLGAELVTLPQNSDGIFDLEWLEEFLSRESAKVILVTAMQVNNETGVINDISKLSAICARFGVPVHVDAVAAIGHLDFDFEALGCATAAVSGHKFGAPIGVGVLLVRRDAQLTPQLHGGGAERGLRSGTASYPMASALALAAELAKRELAANSARWQALSERLISRVLSAIPGARLTAERAVRVPNILNFSFDGVDGEALLFVLDQRGVQVSNGSACTAGVVSASHVLQGMGLDTQRASSAIRISFGVETTEADIDALLAALPDAVKQATAARS